MALGFKKSLFKNILVSGSYIYLAQFIAFLSSIVIARLISPASYGIVGLITVFTGFILVFSDGGLSYALIRSDHGYTYQRVLGNLAWILGFTLFLVTVLFAYPLALFYGNNRLINPTCVLALTFIIKGFSLAPGAILAKQLKFGFIGRVTLICAAITALTTIIMAWYGAGFWSLIVPQILSAVITVVLYEKEVKLGFRIYPMSYLIVGFRHTKKLIGKVIGFNMVNYWARNADNLVVGKWYGESSLGIYNRAYTLLTLPLSLISGLFSNILLPSLKKLRNEGGDMESEYYFVLKVITMLTFPIVLVFILLARPMVLLLWGNTWLPVAELLPYFGLLIFTQTLLSTVGQFLILTDKEHEFMIGGWVSALFLVAGILAGAFISLKAIAQFYSLSYIVFVLTFHIFYTYIGALKFDSKKVKLFWIPKIALSVSIWCSIVLNVILFKIVLLFILFLYLAYDSKTEIISFVKVLQGKQLKKYQ